jgi:hypothetical protein
MSPSIRKILRRTAPALAAAILLVSASAAAVLAYPQPLFAYHVEQGGLQLWSDRPFDPEQGRAVLADVERRITHSPFALDDGPHRIFVANAEWRRRLVFLWNAGAAGVNYFPLHNVFIRSADIDHDRVLRAAGGPVPPPRTLAYYGAHEIGHSLIGARTGALANWRLPRWIREGMADYIGFGGEVDIDALTRALEAGDRDLDPARSGLYARYRLLVAYMLQREGWTAAALLASNLSQAEAERRLLARAR